MEDGGRGWRVMHVQTGSMPFRAGRHDELEPRWQQSVINRACCIHRPCPSFLDHPHARTHTDRQTDRQTETHTHTHTHTHHPSIHPSICCLALRTPKGWGDAGHSGWFYIAGGLDLQKRWWLWSPCYWNAWWQYWHWIICMVKWHCCWWLVEPAWFRARKKQPGWLQCRALSETTDAVVVVTSSHLCMTHTHTQAIEGAGIKLFCVSTVYYTSCSFGS